MTVTDKYFVLITADRAEQNRAYVRALLERNNPGFAAMIEQAVRELSEMCAGAVCACG